MLASIFLLFALCLLPKRIIAQSSFFSLSSWTDWGLDALDYMAYTTGLISSCPYVPNLLDALNVSLPKYIRSQDEGIEAIYNAVAAWEFQKRASWSSSNGGKDDKGEPLVLAFTGSTGVGKTETATRFAEAVLSKTTKVGLTKRTFPQGLLVFRGEDFAPDAISSIAQAQSKIRNLLYDHLKRCSGNAVIVFDEVQKIQPRVLEVLLPALGERGQVSLRDMGARDYREEDDGDSINPPKSMISNHEEKEDKREKVETGESSLQPRSESQSPEVLKVSSNAPRSSNSNMESYPTGNAIFIFISDIGADKMIDLLLMYGSRSKIPRGVLRSKVKMALDEQWQRLKMGKHIHEIVPFLPMAPTDIRSILSLKLNHMNNEWRYKYWLHLVVDDAVMNKLSGFPYIKYSNYSATVVPSSNSDSTSTSQSPSSASVSVTTSATINSNGEADINIGKGEVDRQNANQKVAPVKVTKKFATFGARALENSGPLQDLKSALFRYARPWKPTQVLHIGMADASTKNLQSSAWGWAGSDALSSRDGVFYIQWCVLSNDMFTQSKDSRNPLKRATGGGDAIPTESEEKWLVIPPEIAFSSACETKWVGSLSSLR